MCHTRLQLKLSLFPLHPLSSCFPPKSAGFVLSGSLAPSLCLTHVLSWGGFESERPRSRDMIGCSSADVQPTVCVFVCESYSESISFINTTAIHPKALLMTILMPGSLGARQPPSGDDIRSVVPVVKVVIHWTPQNMNKCPHLPNHSLVSRCRVDLSRIAVLYRPAFMSNS